MFLKDEKVKKQKNLFVAKILTTNQGETLTLTKTKSV